MLALRDHEEKLILRLRQLEGVAELIVSPADCPHIVILVLPGEWVIREASKVVRLAIAPPATLDLSAKSA